MTRKDTRYNRESASKLLPLLSAIGREMRERETQLRLIENELAFLEATPLDIDETPSAREAYAQSLIAEVANHRRELRHAEKELDQLGCTVVGHSPLTIRIPGRVGETKHSFVWQTGDAVLS